MTIAAKRKALEQLCVFVQSGGAAGREKAPLGHHIGLSVSVGSGRSGRDEAMAAIDLAESAGVGVVILDGVKRKTADRSVSLAGLLDYFAPGLVGPILRRAGQSVQVRTANLPDTETIARSTWVGLSVARGYGVHLGKYGCFPMTRLETDAVVTDVQQWFHDWSAAPVFFVDQGLLSESHVDVGQDTMRGLKAWLRTVATRGVRVVLIDTIDKPSGKRLLKTNSKDKNGFLGPKQVQTVEALGRELRVKVLWAGGLGLNDAYKMGKLGVFGIYVTSAAATTIPVPQSYVRDPALAGLKEPSREAVFRVKVLLEAGFLSERLRGRLATQLEDVAGLVMAAHDAKDADGTQLQISELASLCTEGWQKFWGR